MLYDYGYSNYSGNPGYRWWHRGYSDRWHYSSHRRHSGNSGCLVQDIRSNFQKAPQGVLFALKKKLYNKEMLEEQSKNNRIIEIKNQTRERTTNLILAGFGFVAGLAWNEAIKSLIDTLFVIEKNSLLAKFIYAIVVTILVVIVSYFFSKLNTPKK